MTRVFDLGNVAKWMDDHAQDVAWMDEVSMFPTRRPDLGEKLMPAGIPELLSLTGMKTIYRPGGWHQGARRRGKWEIWKPGAALAPEMLREGDPFEAWHEAIGRIMDHAKQVQHSDDHA